MRLGIIVDPSWNIKKPNEFAKALDKGIHVVTGGESRQERTVAMRVKERGMKLTYCVNPSRFRKYHKRYGAEERIFNIVRESEVIIFFGSARSSHWEWVRRAMQKLYQGRVVVIAEGNIANLLELVQHHRERLEAERKAS